MALLSGMNTDPFKNPTGTLENPMFTFRCFQLQEFLSGVYLFPSLSPSQLSSNNDWMFIRKDMSAIREVSGFKETNSYLNYAMIFNRLIQYLNDLTELLELEMNFQGVPVRIRVKEMCHESPCQLVLFFSLLLFRHTTTMKILLKMAALLGRDLTLKTDNSRDYYTPAMGVPTFSNDTVEVLGSLSDKVEGSGNFSRYDITAIGGLYFINNVPLQETYRELKYALQQFLDTYQRAFVSDEYQGIILH
jgi:hypothetical protein